MNDIKYATAFGTSTYSCQQNVDSMIPTEFDMQLNESLII